MPISWRVRLGRAARRDGWVGAVMVHLPGTVDMARAYTFTGATSGMPGHQEAWQEICQTRGRRLPETTTPTCLSGRCLNDVLGGPGRN